MWFPRPRRIESAAFAAPAAFALIAAAMLAACMGVNEAPEAYFNLQADSSLTHYGRVTIQLQDTEGNVQATLYDDSVPSIARLEKLPAGSYRGGPARIAILGYREGHLAYREIRTYDGRTQTVSRIQIYLDSLGNPVANPDTSRNVQVTSPGHAPTLPVFPGDTLVTIRDSVPLPADAADIDGDLAGYVWNCDGRAPDSGTFAGARNHIAYGVSFADSGKRVCTLKVWDKQGNTAVGRVSVHVLLDPPWADAGKDTTVQVSSTIHLHARGEDGMGPIVSREWKIGDGPFYPIPQMETSIQAPADSGDLVCVLRVTDSDSLTATDTLIVHVIPAPAAPDSASP